MGRINELSMYPIMCFSTIHHSKTNIQIYDIMYHAHVHDFPNVLASVPYINVMIYIFPENNNMHHSKTNTSI